MLVFVLVFVRHDDGVSEGAKEVGDSVSNSSKKRMHYTHTHIHINALITDKIMSGSV